MKSRPQIVAVALAALAVSAAPAPALYPPPMSGLPPGEAPPSTDVSVRALAAEILGEAREIVYGPGHKLSELIWDISGIRMAGLAVSVHRGDWSGYAGFMGALNRGHGQMRDYDWQIPGYDWTDYSLSDADMESAWMADAGITAHLARTRLFALRGVAGFRSQYWQWSDRGRDYIYSVEGFRDTRGSFDGRPLIQYEQTYYIPYVGAQVHGGGGRWAWSGYVLVGPYAWARDWDDHVARNLRFEGDFSGGAWLGAGANVEWAASPNWSVAVGAHAQSVPEFKGALRVVELDVQYPDSAGVSLDTVMVDVSMNWRW